MLIVSVGNRRKRKRGGIEKGRKGEKGIKDNGSHEPDNRL